MDWPLAARPSISSITSSKVPDRYDPMHRVSTAARELSPRVHWTPSEKSPLEIATRAKSRRFAEDGWAYSVRRHSW